MKFDMTKAAAIAGSLLVAGCVTPGAAGPDSYQQLVGKEWVIENIAGRGVIDDARASLRFRQDGRLSGEGSCNRIIAGYTVDGSKLKISQAGLTMMACPPAVMDQERRFVDVLNTVASYRIDPTGALVLTSSTGATVTAR